ncbi:MAG: glycerate-2-kinase [Bradymonadia bacterium]|jgi:glycerate-2-kinase
MPRAIAQSIYDAALGAVDPRVTVRRAFERDRELLRSLLDRRGRLVIVGYGKAAVGMVKGICDARIEADDGIIIVPEHAHRPAIQGKVLVSVGGHPTPTEGGRRAARVLKRKIERLSASDTVLVVVSGGGSALGALPRREISLAELRRTNDILLWSGLPIEAMNAVRRRLTVFGGGGLARLAAPARVVSLILSDVASDHAGLVASGPTAVIQDKEAFQEVLRRVDIVENLPGRVRSLLFEVGAAERSVRATNILVASNEDAVKAGARAAERLGFETTIGPTLDGLASRAGRAVGRELAASPGSRRVVIRGGETTVRIPAGMEGIGGRSQELALAAALELEGTRAMCLLAAGTDGIDGPTPAAGAIVDGETVDRVRASGIQPELALRGHDSYRALDASGDLLVCGPTGTNVADICVLVSMGCDA